MRQSKVFHNMYQPCTCRVRILQGFTVLYIPHLVCFCYLYHYFNLNVCLSFWGTSVALHLFITLIVNQTTAATRISWWSQDLVIFEKKPKKILIFTSFFSERCNLECGPHGSCESGRCVCNPGWQGDVCSVKTCDPRCSAHGMCSNGTCLCTNGK